MQRSTLKDKEKAATPPDFTLVFSRMEKEIILGKNESVCRRILARESIWKNVGVERQLKWARLAQMAGDAETALKVLTHINQSQPKVVQAWVERVELLSILDRPEQMAQALAISKSFVSEEKYQTLLGLRKDPNSPEPDGDLGAAAAPFEKLRHLQDTIARYLELFSGREDCFARQWVNKPEGKQGYVPVRRPIERQDVEEHLRGRKTYGIYLLKNNATVKVAVIDVDLVQRLRQGNLNAEERSLVKRERCYVFSRIKEMGAEAGLSPLVEFSGGKGFHFWFFFDTPVEAAKVKRALERIKNSFSKDLSAFNIEVFPKQDQLSGKGLGNLVKLPLGVHRATGKSSYFVECHHRSVEAQLDFLSRIEPARPDHLLLSENNPQEEKVFVHPRWQKWADEYPELFKLESLCPPLAQIIAACRNGASMSQREEKVIFQTIGFLPRGKALVHHLTSFAEDYNSHLVDFKLSRLRGRPLGCKRIHSILSFNGDMCPFNEVAEYAHPLLHVEQWKDAACVKAEKVENLSSALDNLKLAMSQVHRFLS